MSSLGKNIVLSTGMSKISEIDEAIETVRSTGNKNLAILHCNSSYPSTYSEVNLKFMQNLKLLYQVPVGFSDHTTDLLSSKTAITLGANIIERHFKDLRNTPSPDDIHALTKDEFSELLSIQIKEWVDELSSTSNQKISIVD